MKTALLATAIVMATAASAADTLTDDQLVARATEIFAKKEGPVDSFLGVNHGARVRVLVRCGDICPAYTVRVIFYDLAEGKSCAQAGGHDMSVIVPHGIAAGPESFCIPAALFKKDLYSDHPYRQKM